MEQLARELKYAWRSIGRAPILSAVIVLSLGVGIGVNTVVFSWLQALVFRPLPGVTDASAFHLIESITEAGPRPGVSWSEYRDLKERVRSLSDLIAFRMVPLNIGEASRNERATALLVSGNYFSGLGITPALGRFIRPEETSRPGDAPVVVVSSEFWQTRLGGSPDVIGQTLRVNDRDLIIVGVTPDRFQGTVLGLQFDLWVPATLAPVLLAGSRELDDRNLRGYYVMGRLSSGSRQQAQAEVDGVMRQLAGIYPESNKGMRAEVLQFWRASRGPQGLLLQGVGILQGVMLLLLLAVCGNTANLMLARASARQREVSVRLAMGAGAWRIARLLLVENLVLGVGASAIGVLIAMWGSEALRAMPIMTTAFPVRLQTGLNEAGLAFAVVLGILCALAFGAAPALHLARIDAQQVLRSGSNTAPRGRVRNALVAIEVALALTVLISAGLFLRSFQETRDDTGFERNGILLAAYDLTGRQVTGTISRDVARRLLDRLRAIPDVEAAAISTSVPLDIHGLPVRSFTLEGRARTDGTPDRILTNTVTPGYFTTMRIPLLAGTDFVELSDTTTPPQVIVNQEFVRRYVQNGETLGRRVENGDRAYFIAGVVRNSLYDSFGEPPRPIIYFSYRDRPAAQGEIHVRPRVGDETMLGPAVRRAVREVDASLPVYNVRTMAQHVETNLALRRIPARMFAVLGPLLLLLAAIGIYAVVAYTVSHRTTEIGVRLALGATASGVVTQIVSESLRVVAAGAAAGWLLVFMVYSHLVRGPLDVPSFVGVPALLLAVAALACWVPARRALRIDPIAALRHE